MRKTEFKRAAKIEPTAVTFFMEAMTFEYLHTPDSAYDKALKLDPDIFDTYKKRGLYNFMKKDYRAAYRDLPI